MKKEERVGRMILQRIAANGEDERREGRGRNGGGGWGGAREVGVGGIKICIDASQIYRGKGFLSVLALSPMVP